MSFKISHQIYSVKNTVFSSEYRLWKSLLCAFIFLMSLFNFLYLKYISFTSFKWIWFSKRKYIAYYWFVFVIKKGLCS